MKSRSQEVSELVGAATELATRRAKRGLHHVACALRTTDGRTFTGLHISAEYGTGSICAEASAVSSMVLASDTARIELVASVRKNFETGAYEIVPPCGRCRELIFQHGRESSVVLQVGDALACREISTLLPSPFARRRQGNGSWT